VAQEELRQLRELHREIVGLMRQGVGRDDAERVVLAARRVREQAALDFYREVEHVCAIVN
jgi:hypothetical protein